MPIAIPCEVPLSSTGRCASHAAVCAAPLPDGRISAVAAIPAREGFPYIVRPPEGADDVSAIFPCPCTGAFSDSISEVFGPEFGDHLMAIEEPAQSESRPALRSEAAPDVILDARELVLRVEGRAIGLTRTQFSILSYLIENGGRWVTTGELIRQVLGTHHQPDTSLVRVHVHAIRRRLGSRAPWLESDRRRARGYRWRGMGAERDELAKISS